MDSLEARARRRARPFDLDSPEQWKSLARWDQRALPIADVAAILDTVDRTHSLLPGFLTSYPPSPLRGEQWSLAQVYNYLLSENRSGGIIPRLFPTSSHPGTPARLLFTQAVDISAGGQEFAVHAWDPRDNRGRIAIAYPVRDCPGGNTPQAAHQLMVRLSWASAVVVPADEDTPVSWGKVQPVVWVADGRRNGTDPETFTERHTWGDVANLLRIDVPWWSPGLRDRDTMLTWRPYDDPIPIAPGTAERDPQALRNILTPESSPALRHTVDEMIREVHHELCGSYEYPYCYDHHRASLGLIQAATAAMDYRSPRPQRTPSQAALFLHHEVSNPLTAAHAAAVAGGHPIAHCVYVVTPRHQENPIVRAWVAQLRPARRRDEIGFHLALRALPTPAAEDDPLETPTRIGYFTDPYWPDSWIVAQGDTIAVTCGNAVPAQGTCERPTLTARSGFSPTAPTTPGRFHARGRPHATPPKPWLKPSRGWCSMPAPTSRIPMPPSTPTPVSCNTSAPRGYRSRSMSAPPPNSERCRASEWARRAGDEPESRIELFGQDR